MDNKGNVLAVIELDNNPEETLNRAIWIAEFLDRGIDLLLCEQEGGTILDGYAPSNESERLRAGIREALDDILSELAAVALQANQRVTTSLLEERPIADGIMTHAERSEPCVIVKGTHFHSVAKRGILVDTDWQLMRTCPHPLWLVKSETIRENPVIVAAVDPTHKNDKSAGLDQRIVETALRVAGSTSGDVHLLHTYQRLIAIGKAANRALTSSKLPIDELDERIKANHAQALQRLADANGIDAEHTHQLPGRTHELLPAFVRSRKADLVVMGGDRTLGPETDVHRQHCRKNARSPAVRRADCSRQ